MTKKSAAKAVTKKRIETLLDGTTGTNNRVLNMQLINQAAASLWIPEELSEDERMNRIASAIALLKGIKPADEIEGLLATQMVATHSAAMECLRRAMIQDQTFEGRDQNLKHATKLLGIYARQMDALNKHRGKGQQKVTVEHVHVEAGGQAVVGHVNATPAAAQQPAQKALPNAPGETLDLKVEARSKARVKRSRS